jgi:ubiquinone/menaquinone biosynthesis C-methylase UbiE
MSTKSVDYDRIAANYDRRYRESRYDDVEKELRAWLQSVPRRRVLEVGCGTGHWLQAFRAAGQLVLGLDLSPAMLERARSAAPDSPLVNGNALRLPFADASFDALFCINALHHFTDKPRLIAEAARVLVPGGEFCTVGLDPHCGPPRWMIYEYFAGTRETDAKRFPPHEKIQAWLEEAGFTGWSARVVLHLRARLPADQALASPMMRRDGTSQLALLSDAAYREGIERIRAAMVREEAEGRVLHLEADLQLFATKGRRPC